MKFKMTIIIFLALQLSFISMFIADKTFTLFRHEKYIIENNKINLYDMEP